MYKKDILSDKSGQLSIELKDDYEGRNTASLIRRPSNGKSDSAVLYIHGFNERFFQKETTLRFNERNYSFYAL